MIENYKKDAHLAITYDDLFHCLLKYINSANRHEIPKWLSKLSGFLKNDEVYNDKQHTKVDYGGKNILIFLFRIFKFDK